MSVSVDYSQAGVITYNSERIAGLADPSGAQDAATKNYVDTNILVPDIHVVRLATTTNGTLATAFANGQTIDAVTLVTGDRILLKDQTTGSENGIYTVNASGAPTRATDYNTSANLKTSSLVSVSEGTINKDSFWMLSTDSPITVGSTTLNFRSLANPSVLRMRGGDTAPNQPTGTNAIAIGSGSTASNSYSLAGGQNSTASGIASFAFGTNSQATQQGAFALGDNTTASATSAFALGSSSTASGGSSFASGSQTLASATTTTAIGSRSKASLVGQFSLAGGTFLTVGDAQTSFVVMRLHTTDGTTTEMLLPGGGSLTLSNDTTWFFKIHIVARRTDVDGESAGYTGEGVIFRDTSAGTTTMLSVTTTTVAESTAAWDVSFSADTGAGSLKITVTGQAAKAIHWVACVHLTEVTG